MADPLDLLTLPEGYAAISDVTSAAAGTGSNDGRLAAMITAISRRVDDLCGPVVRRTITGEEQPGGDPTIQLRYYPVASVTTITEYNGTSPTVLAAENFPSGVTQYDYKILDEGKSGLISRRAQGYGYVFAGDRVIVTYSAGRATSTETVDPKFKEAASAILKRLWKREAGSWASGGDPFSGDQQFTFFRAITPMVEEFLGYEMRGPQVA